MAHISVVIPVYKAEDCLHELYSRLKNSLGKIAEDFEIILVEDCGGDRSWEIIKELGAIDYRVKGIRFSRNFGQHYGITAGLDYATGVWVVVMDCDLQDQPEEIEKLYNKAVEGNDVVLARRKNRQDNFLKKLSSKVFYKIFDYLTETVTDPTVGTFRILSRQVVDNFVDMKEKLRFFGGMIQWIGFPTTYVDIEHAQRFCGKSTYSFKKLVNLAFGAMIAFSDTPLRISIKLGFLMSVSSVSYALYMVYRKLVFGVDIQGWTSLIVSIYFLSGLIFLNLGILGLYIGRIFDEVKGRPLYIVREVNNFEQDNGSCRR